MSVTQSAWSRLTGLLATGLAASSLNAASARPLLLLTNIPAYGSTNPLAGETVGADPATTRVAAFVYVPGAGWWSKPTCAQPLTPLTADGSWSANIATGGADPSATRVAAVLLSTNFSAACAQGLSYLPTNLFGQALASGVLTRPSPNVRWLSFSGYDWWVKSSAGKTGPGPNFFSDSTNNVWTDASGQLHVRITNRSNTWQCAELVSARTFGYGSYRFELNSRVDNFDPNVVLGLFTWSDDPVFANREIDVECSRFGNAIDPTSAQFVVQPYNLSAHLQRYALPPITNSTQVFTWRANGVDFQSQRGSYSPTPPPTNVIASWSYSSATPQTGDENVRINLWLFNGLPPSDNQEVEVVLKSFQFSPADPPVRPKLVEAGLGPDGSFHVRFNTEPDRHYAVQISSDLANWQSLETLLATNVTAEFFVPGPAANQAFLRVLALQ